MSTLFATRGLPASGKTTWAREQTAANPEGTVVVCRDDLRKMLSNGFVAANEKAVNDARDALVNMYLKRGFDVIVADTNFPNRVMRDLRNLAERNKAYFQIVDFTDTPRDECIRRDSRRTEGRVGSQVIADMHKRFLMGRKLPLPYPEPEDAVGGLKPYEPDLSKPPAVICDIDGTIALRGERGPFEWNRVMEDEPNLPIVDMVRDFHRDGIHVIFTSARMDECLSQTADWLDAHVLDHGDFSLHMRASEDYRKDWVVKAELFDRFIRHEWNVQYVLDDRDQVVKMWRAMGLTCLQVADGDF